MARYTLTTRDLELLGSLCNYRYLSVSQLHTLHFPSRQTAYRRLRALTNLGYLKLFTVPTIPERLYYLPRQGAATLADHLGMELSDLPWSQSARQPKDYYFLRHFLALNDFRIALSQASEASEIKLLGFIPDYEATKTPRGGLHRHIRDEVPDVTHHAKPIAHTPDAAFGLKKGGKPALFFLEIDRGTEVVSDPSRGFLKAVLFYLNYWKAGRYHRYETEFESPNPFKAFRLLVVTTSEARIETMREATTRLPFPDPAPKRFFWATTPDRIDPDTLFQPIWRSLDLSDDQLYRIG